jgi:TonB family protein
MTPLRPRLRARAGSVALTFSILCHLGLALLATRHFRATAIAPELTRSPSELITADIELLADADQAPSTKTELLAPASRAAAHGAIPRNSAPSASPTPAHANAGVAKSEPEPEPEPATLSTAAESSGPKFKITLAPTIGSAWPNSSGSLVVATPAGSTNQPFSSASVDTPARLRSGDLPAYTAAALAAGIEANVPLEIVVSDSGGVTSVRGLDHVGYGLDEAALQSVLGYRFTPASRGGRTVAVRMRWLMRFQLR